MLNTAKILRHTNSQDHTPERRKSYDRRESKSETRFPFIDDNRKLVMKDRRVANRRESDAKLMDKSLKVVKGLFKK